MELEEKNTGSASGPNVEGRKLGDSFMVGTDRVEVLTHRVTAADGTSFELSLEAMQLLVALAARPGRLVRFDALTEEIWGSTRVSLERNRAEIAHHFGDDDRDPPRYIEIVADEGYRLLQTVHPGAVPFNAKHSQLLFIELSRRKVFRVAAGYCVFAFVALQISDATFGALELPQESVPILIIGLIVGFPVAVLLAWFLETKSGTIELDSESGWFRRMGRRWEVSALVALFLFSTIFAFSVSRSIDLGPSTSRDVSIAVLPFKNFTGDAANDHLALAIPEDVTSALSVTDGIAVASRTDAFLRANAGIDVRTLARILDVDFVVEGSFVRLDDSLRVVAQVIDGRSSKHHWTQQYALAELSTLSTVIATDIAEGLGMDEPAPARRPGFAPTEDAYQVYLEGRARARNRRDLASLQEAERLLAKASNMTPNFVAAESALCTTRFAIFGLTQDLQQSRIARVSCGTAAAYPYPDPAVLAALAHLQLLQGNYRAAIKAFEDATVRDPSDADLRTGLGMAYEQLGVSYFNEGDWDAAHAIWQQALQTHPAVNVYLGLGRLHYLAGRFDDAHAVLRAGLSRFSHQDEMWGQLGYVSLATGGNHSYTFRRALDLAAQSRDVVSQARRAAYLAQLGFLARASTLASNDRLSRANEGIVHYWRALAFVHVGDPYRARASLKRCRELGTPNVLTQSDPYLAPLSRTLASAQSEDLQ